MIISTRLVPSHKKERPRVKAHWIVKMLGFECSQLVGIYTKGDIAKK
jgi:hypothetical protein